MCLQINQGLQQQLIVLVVSLPLGLHPSPLGGFVLHHLGLRPSPLGPLACIWPVYGFSSLGPYFIALLYHSFFFGMITKMSIAKTLVVLPTLFGSYNLRILDIFVDLWLQLRLPKKTPKNLPCAIS